MTNLYLPEGWLNVPMIDDLDVPFVFVFGGRGIGKSYGVMDEINTRHRGKSFFMRRTQTEFDVISDNKLNMFSTYNEDHGTDIHFERQKNIATILDGSEEIGFAAALSTFSNIRGFDRFSAEIMYYDEFIPERHKAKIRNESDAFLNVYESINRNRELLGRKPLKVRCFANSNDIKNPLFLGLNLVTMAEKMKRKEKEIMIDGNRGIALVDCCYSPISQKKAQTALYRMAGASEFFNMAIKNEFNSNLFPSVSRRLVEYKPLVGVGEICVYQHKSNGKFYVSGTIQKSAPYFPASDTMLEMYRMRFGFLLDRYFDGLIEFESNITQLLFMTYLKMI